MPAFSVPENLAFDSYGDLVAALNDWLDRSDLTGSAQSMIALAEARMRRELEPLFGEVSGSATAVDGLAALPADCGTLKRVMYNGRNVPQLGVGAAANVPTSYSEPYAYTVEAGNIRLWPSGDFTVLLLYRQTLSQLSEASPTNTLLNKHPDVYFFGAMMFAEGYLANDTRALLFANLWEGALDSAKTYFTRQMFAGPLVPRVVFVP